MAAAWCVSLVAMRNAMLAAGVAAIMAFVRPVPRPRWPWGAVLAAILAGGAAIAWGISKSPAWERAVGTMAHAAALEREGLSIAALERISSSRLVLILAAWDIGREHPVLGGGAGWFASRLPIWAMDHVVRRRAEYIELSGFMEGGVSHVHSTLVHEWVDGGIPSVALLGSVLLGLAWRLWRQARASPIAGAALALYSLVLLYLPLGIITLKAPGALIAVCLAISWLGLGYRVAKPIT